MSWGSFNEFHFQGFLVPTYVNLEIPDPDRGPYVMLRWWQPDNEVCGTNLFIISLSNLLCIQGFNEDQWSIDDVIVGGSWSQQRPKSTLVTRDVESYPTFDGDQVSLILIASLLQINFIIIFFI